MAEIPTITSLDDLEDAVERHPGLCVRYSKGPDHDVDSPSVDYESKLELPGLSCNPLEPESWWMRDAQDWLARQLCHYVHLAEQPDRCAWVLTGEVAGRGPDREPLLMPWRAVAYLADSVIDEARQRYEEHFDVGRDSTG